MMGCLGRGDGEEESRRLAGLSEEGASGLQRAEKVQKKKSAIHQGKWALLSLGIWEEKDLDQVSPWATSVSESTVLVKQREGGCQASYPFRL